MIFDAIAGLTKGIASTVTTYLTNRAQISAQLQINKMKMLQAAGDRQAQIISQGMAETSQWELASLQAGQAYRGFELYVLSIPVVMCFTPSCAPLVEAGFHALALTPHWYQTLLIGVYSANYGIRLGHAATAVVKKIASIKKAS